VRRVQSNIDNCDKEVEPRVERGLELDTILGLFFGYERRGALGLAFS